MKELLHVNGAQADQHFGNHAWSRLFCDIFHYVSRLADAISIDVAVDILVHIDKKINS